MFTMKVFKKLIEAKNFGNNKKKNLKQSIEIDKIFNEIKNSGELDNPYILLCLAKCYELGNKCQDKDKAYEIYRKLLETGLPEAEYALAYNSIHPVSNEQKIDYILSSANRGFASAQYDIGMRFYYGDEVPKNVKKAQHYLDFAARQKYTLAYIGLAMYYISIEDNCVLGLYYSQLAKIYKVKNWEKIYKSALIAIDAEKGGLSVEKLENKYFCTEDIINRFYKISQIEIINEEEIDYDGFTSK